MCLKSWSILKKEPKEVKEPKKASIVEKATFICQFLVISYYISLEKLRKIK